MISRCLSTRLGHRRVGALLVRSRPAAGRVWMARTQRQRMAGFLLSLMFLLVSLGAARAAAGYVDFINESSARAQFVVLYPNPPKCGNSDPWEATGWFGMDPGGSATAQGYDFPGAHDFYFYAEWPETGWVSPNQTSTGRIGTYITRSAFSRCIGENSSPGGDYFHVLLNQVNVDEQATDFKVTLTENGEWRAEGAYGGSSDNVHIGVQP